MRKLLALLFVAAAFTFTACDKGGETANTADTVATDSAAVDPIAPAPVEADTAAGDTAAADTSAN